jgi:hypothetical protein
MVAGAIGGPISDNDVARLFKSMAYDARLPDGVTEWISGHTAGLAPRWTWWHPSQVVLPAIIQVGRSNTPVMVERYTPDWMRDVAGLPRWHDANPGLGHVSAC